jgi:epoxyqueuosine reductase
MQGTAAQSERIVQKARESGASLAGITSVARLAASRSYAGEVPVRGAIDGHALLVLALAEGEQWPEFDWWDSQPGGTPGNRRLGNIMEQLIDWLDAEENLPARPLPYNIEKGGIFLKGAAILAGVGAIGKNNLLMTPDFGPRVRLRAMHLQCELPQTGPLDFDFCSACDMPCRRACPQGAFDDGVFNRKRCSIQMRRDKLERGGLSGEAAFRYLERPIKYCRACELSCPLAIPS